MFQFQFQLFYWKGQIMNNHHKMIRYGRVFFPKKAFHGEQTFWEKNLWGGYSKRED